MDNGLAGSSRVKPIQGYLKESVRFYDMDKPLTAQVTFIIQLVLLFGGYFLAMPSIQKVLVYFEQVMVKLQGQMAIGQLDFAVLESDVYTQMARAMGTVLVILITMKVLSFFVALFYGTHYFFGLTEPSFSGVKRSGIFFSRLPKLILFNVLFYFLYYVGVLLITMALGLLTIFIPVISFLSFLLPLFLMVIDSLFVFKDLLIIEFNIGFFNNFKKSLSLTKNNKKNIIINMLWPVSIGWLLIAIATDGNNALLSVFISSFLQAIILLVSQRLSALMFIDAASLERKDARKVTKQNET